MRRRRTLSRGGGRSRKLRAKSAYESDGHSQIQTAHTETGLRSVHDERAKQRETTRKMKQGGGRIYLHVSALSALDAPFRNRVEPGVALVNARGDVDFNVVKSELQGEAVFRQNRPSLGRAFVEGGACGYSRRGQRLGPLAAARRVQKLPANSHRKPTSV
jgi:hypothetical protein